MNILFVNYSHLNTNSGIHIFNLANHLSRRGMDCTVGVPSRKETVVALGTPSFEVLGFDDLRRGKGKNGKKFDLIHAWTPREVVRRAVVDLRRSNACPLLIHLEDNEEYLIEAYTGISAGAWRRMPSLLPDMLIPPYLSHPMKYPDFLAGADGITVITDGLREFVPKAIPSEVIWAGYQEDMQWELPRDIELRNRLGITDEDFVVVYTGNIHAANLQEMKELYAAIADLRGRGYKVKLARTGIDQFRFPDRELRALKSGHCIELGHLPRSRLPSVLSIADALVQPGKPDLFNNFRFPSKLPEYLASGKPVILPRANIGAHLKDKEECLFLEEGNAPDLAQKVEQLILDKDLRNRIGTGGRLFAERNLKWGRIADTLRSFYRMFL